jgi:hypothetical protein
MAPPNFGLCGPQDAEGGETVTTTRRRQQPPWGTSSDRSGGRINWIHPTEGLAGATATLDRLIAEAALLAPHTRCAAKAPARPVRFGSRMDVECATAGS